MELYVYNTLTRKKEKFKPLKEGNVGVYGCGPTVYWYQHIGNLRRYVFEDILIRVLEYDGYKVNHIINITDVGHLTGDEDEGEDKIEKAAKKEKKSAKEIAEYYFNVFKEDLEKMNIKMPDKWPKATEHIKEQIEIVKKLEKKGFTYETSDGIYFDTSKLNDYGKLAKLNIEGLEEGKRVVLGEKKNKTDFALWKFSNEQEGKRQQEWNPKKYGVDWKIGFPGWHIECSAMSSKYLGEQFDIHTGGIDHIPVHHTNEIVQSETAFGKKPWVKYWMHSGFLTAKGEKVSKSKGGLLTLSELNDKGFNPLDYRYLCLGTHYRKPLDFSFKNIENAKNTYERLKKKVQEIKDDKEINKQYLKEFEEAINDDLNVPKGLQVLWRMIRDKKAKGKIKTINKMDEVFGLKLLEEEPKIEIPEKVKILVEEREKYRSQKNFNKADELRDKIKNLGFKIDDSEKQTKIRKI